MSRRNHSILELFRPMPKLHGSDEFGKTEQAKRGPLLLDKTLNGLPRPGASSSRLLSLPADILAEIVDCLFSDGHALAKLALVNSTCRQLARSCQFADICFNYSPASQNLIRVLLSEATHSSNGTPKPSIGPCIRRLTVRTDREWVATFHAEVYDHTIGMQRESGRYTKEQKQDLIDAATHTFFGEYIPALLQAIKTAMPHLEAVVWSDDSAVDVEFFAAITHPPALRHLKLANVLMEELIELGPPFTSPALPLVALEMDVGWSTSMLFTDPDNPDPDGYQLSTPSMSPFLESIFRLCAPTLQSLRWGCLPYYRADRANLLDGSDIRFPRLQDLDLQTMFISVSSSGLLSLLASPLRVLRLPRVHRPPAIAAALANAPILRDLDTLALADFAHVELEKVKDCVENLLLFLKNHSHVRKLVVSETDDELMNMRIVPLLSPDRFSNLSSLHLNWAGPGRIPDAGVFAIPAESLQALGRLTSLEQLCIIGGHDQDSRYQWHIDHDVLRASLAPLQNLKNLALCKDTYRAFGSVSEMYYLHRLVGPQEQRDARRRPELDREDDENMNDHYVRTERDRPVGQGETAPGEMVDDAMSDQQPNSSDYDDDVSEHDDSEDENDLTEGEDFSVSSQVIWERAHRNRMLSEAEKYAKILPALQWMLCGEWPMALVNNHKKRRSKKATPLSKERDTCRTLLRNMFGLGPMCHDI